jgi:hypothetical protein
MCNENATGTSVYLDTLHDREATIDVKFSLSQLPELCDYNFRPDYHVLRLKLILDTSSEYAKVTVSEHFHYFSRQL